MCHVSGGTFCRAYGGEGPTKGERGSGVRGILWSNWGADYADEKATVFTGKAVVMDSGFCGLKGLLGMLAHGVHGTTDINKKYILPSTAREMPLMHASKTRRLGIFMMFVVICMGKSARYSV